MPENLETQLRRKLQLGTGSADVLVNRESQTLEFKQTFAAGSLATYGKTMAAFANNRGGFIVFGVEPSPHRLRGVGNAFGRFDPSKLADYVGTDFSPSLDFELEQLELHGITLGFIYTHENRSKPVITSRNSSSYSEGQIFYRYAGQSKAIRFSELRQIIEDRLSIDRRAWMAHLSTISSAGPTNVGIVDTVRGTLHGAGAQYLIDEPLLRELRVVREGRFVDTGGDPALRLVGELRPVAGIAAERAVHVGIHAEEILTALLAQRELTPEEARTYLRETSYQTSPFYPVWYFKNRAKLTQAEAVALIRGSTSTLNYTKRGLVERLQGNTVLKPIGAPPGDEGWAVLDSAEAFLAALASESKPREQRAAIVELIDDAPVLIAEVATDVNVVRFCEAVTHVLPARVRRRKDQLLGALLRIIQDRFSGLTNHEKSTFRRAVCYVDQELFR